MVNNCLYHGGASPSVVNFIFKKQVTLKKVSNSSSPETVPLMPANIQQQQNYFHCLKTLLWDNLVRQQSNQQSTLLVREEMEGDVT
jgi:hypothetical protein